MKKIILTFIILAGILYTANAKSWRVNNTPGINADFSTLAAAQEGAAEGDTLFIEGSTTSYSNFIITKKLILIGPGFFLLENDLSQATKITASLSQLEINQTASGTVVSGLVMSRLYNRANNVVITRNKVYGNTNDWGLYLAWDYDLHDVVVSQNYCSFIKKSKKAKNTLIFNNIVIGNIDMGENADDFTGVIKNNTVGGRIDVMNAVVKNNIIYATGEGYKQAENSYTYNLYAGASVPSGTGNVANIDMNTVFTDFTHKNVDNDFTLREGSPAAGAGENGTDCGAFGGDQPYVLSGIPAIPHIYEAIIPTSASNDSGLKVYMKIKTNN